MGELSIRIYTVMPFDENCYIVSDETGEGVVIDPGGDGEAILAHIRKENIDVKAVLDTHGHCDHIGANDVIRDATGAPLYIHEADAPMLTDMKLNLAAFMGFRAQSRPAEHLLAEGDVIRFGTSALRVLHTPGHTAGGVCFVGDGVVFTGDTLFADSVGRTDFPGGSSRTLIKSIKEKLFALADDCKAYPGHGPATNIGWEKQHNPFLRIDW